MLCGFTGSQSRLRTWPLFSSRGALKEPSFSVTTSCTCRINAGGQKVINTWDGNDRVTFDIDRQTEGKERGHFWTCAYLVYWQLLAVCGDTKTKHSKFSPRQLWSCLTVVESRSRRRSVSVPALGEESWRFSGSLWWFLSCGNTTRWLCHGFNVAKQQTLVSN